MPIVIIGPDRSLITDAMELRDGYEILEASPPGNELLRIVSDDDLVIAPSFLLPEIPLPRRIRLANRLAEVNLAVVAGPGPGRLNVTRGFLANATSTIVGPKL
jgi:hypothetical protein